jgi:chemotaxis protein MotC
MTRVLRIWIFGSALALLAAAAVPVAWAAEEGEAHDAAATAETPAKAEEGEKGHEDAPKAEGGEKAESAEAAAEGGEKNHGEEKAEGHGEEEKSEPEKPVAIQLWPETPAVENERQPYVLMRSLRSVQDQVAQGSTAAHQFQKNFMRDLGIQLIALPPAVWDDVRNVRAAAYFVLSGGDPRVLRIVTDRDMPDFIDRRVLRGAFAYGQGRSTDAKALLEKTDARSLDPALGGMLSLIKGVLHAKSDPKKAIGYFDDARLLSPGTLVEESALRQQILLLAKEGDTARFDLLSDQYSRRFSKSLFASTFRRQFVAGFARQSYKGMSDWISRTETELRKVPEEERLGMYLAIAEEATKGGHFEIAKFASDNALKLAVAGTKERSRASLYDGAILIATDDYDQGLARLAEVDESQLGASDREIYDAALLVSRRVRQWPAAPVENSDPMPESVTRAQQLISQADTLLGGGTQ